MIRGRSATELGVQPGLPISGLLNLFVVYVVWGSTYLAIRIAVREGAGWGPFWLGATRLGVAAALLYGVNRLRGVRLKPTRAELQLLLISGILLWVFGNGAVIWAEQRMDSSLAALIVGTMPMWVAAMEALIDRRAPSLLLSTSLVIGFGGLTALSYPVLRAGAKADLVGVLAVVFAAVSWGIASILLNRSQLELDPVVASGWQHFVGCLGFVVLALLFGESAPHPTAAAWAAWAYLVVLGSLAFTSFLYAVKVLPTAVVMTYAYVNPVIAVILGRMILSEPITSYTIIGMVLIVGGVYGVFRGKAKQRAAPSSRAA